MFEKIDAITGIVVLSLSQIFSSYILSFVRFIVTIPSLLFVKSMVLRSSCIMLPEYVMAYDKFKKYLEYVKDNQIPNARLYSLGSFEARMISGTLTSHDDVVKSSIGKGSFLLRYGWFGFCYIHHDIVNYERTNTSYVESIFTISLLHSGRSIFSKSTDCVLTDFLQSIIGSSFLIDGSGNDNNGNTLGRSIKIKTQQNGYWSSHDIIRAARQLSTVIYNENDISFVLKQCEHFLRPETELWYQKMGIPYHIGFLFAGPPGTGKSSLIMALLTELNLQGSIMSMSEAGLTDYSIRNLLKALPPRSALIIEDIDCAFSNRSNLDNMGDVGASKCKVTMSGFLNAIDGITAPFGIIYLFTTNHIDLLDPAILRPGRIDHVVRMNAGDKNQIMQMFCRFFPSTTYVKEGIDYSRQYADAFGDYPVTMSEVQNHLLPFASYMTDTRSTTKIVDVINSVPDFVEKLKSRKDKC